MGCNDYNLHLDSSSGEQPTPEFKIYLDGVGVNGYSPTVDIVNSTSSSFQIQVNDIDGTELTSPIPKLDYITNNYVSNTSLASTLANYSTTSEIASAYLKVDGSNANNPITINNISLRSYTSGNGRISTTGTLQIHGSNTNIYGTSVGIDVKANSIDLGNWSSGKYLEIDTAVKYGTTSTKYEIATLNDIPTVGNGTITLTQGGVTKGTFTTNQSGNTTIDLDAGGGSITNPLVINSDNGLKNLSIGYNSDNELSILSTWLYNGTVPIPMPAYLIGGTSNPISLSDTSANHGLKTINLNYDSDTLDLNASNELTVKGMVGADGTNAGSAGLVPVPTATDNTKFLRGDGTWQNVGGGSSYTAGTGIDITNDVISVDNTVAMKTDIPSTSNFVTTNTAQTITANKVFDDSGILFYDEINDTNRNGITYNESVGIYVGDAGERLLLQGKDTHPYYNNNSLALSSEIPDVSNFVTNSSLATTLASYVQSSSLATVATTGNYTDLNGRPNLNAYVTIDTTQTISGTKTFSSETHHTGVITFDSALLNPIIRGMSGASYRNMIYRMGNNSAIIVGNSSDTIDLKGSGTRPTYNTNSLALYSDIPNLTGYATETWVSSQGYLTSSDISDMATQTWVEQQGYITGITSSDVTTALGYTPYNATNPNGFISGIDLTMVVTALGYTPYADSNPDGFISGISSTDVVNALGYTPYSNSNPNGYTSNVGTVTSVNNTQPDANGNVTINLTPTVIDGGNA